MWSEENEEGEFVDTITHDMKVTEKLVRRAIESARTSLDALMDVQRKIDVGKYAVGEVRLEYDMYCMNVLPVLNDQRCLVYLKNKYGTDTVINALEKIEGRSKNNVQCDKSPVQSDKGCIICAITDFSIDSIGREVFCWAILFVVIVVYIYFS